MSTICFVGPYLTHKSEVAEYTHSVCRELGPQHTAIIAFEEDRQSTHSPIVPSLPAERVWYGIPEENPCCAPAILEGVRQLGANSRTSVLWFHHIPEIWGDDNRFVSMIACLALPKIVTLHNLHYQSNETPYGLRRQEYNLLQGLLPHVDAITVFTHGVYQAVTGAFPTHRGKTYMVKHGIHRYPDIQQLSRREAKEKLNDFVLFESTLDPDTKQQLHQQRVFTNPHAFVLGQTGFMNPMKYSELLFAVRDALQQLTPHKSIVAVRIGSAKDKSQTAYCKQLRCSQDRSNKLILETWLPEDMLPIAHRAFDINFYWPNDCTQSSIMTHALGAGAIIAGREIEGVGEMLREAGGLTHGHLRNLIEQMKSLIHNPDMGKRIEANALQYAELTDWTRQSRRHVDIANHIPARTKTWTSTCLALLRANTPEHTPADSVITRDSG